MHETYTQVPDETRQALADILQQLDVQPGDDPHRILAAVQSYVSSSARYDLNTPAVPDGEDFVSWFLHESETGYCVHFATAAAILLRCMDVPARYVTGFSTNVTAGSWTTVTTDDAHAWVEYYVDGLGWYVLDPTPAMQDSHILTCSQIIRRKPIRPRRRRKIKSSRSRRPLRQKQRRMRRKFLRKRLINRPKQTRRVQKHSISSVISGQFWPPPRRC